MSRLARGVLKLWFYVMLPPEDVGFTWFHPPKNMVSRGFASRRRCFEVTCPPENVDLTSLYLPKTLVLHVRGFSPRKRLSFRGPTSRKGWFHVILHPENVFVARCFSSRGPWFDVG